MKLLVCVKQVADLESRFKPNAAGTWYDEADVAFRMNEYDEYAVEEAVRLKEKLGGEPDLTVISIGPERVGEAIKKALAMGCDRGVHVLDPDAASKDPSQIAAIIAAFAKDKGFDLVFTGMQSQDRGSAQVGLLVAERLGIAALSTMVAFEWADGVIAAKRELEGGIKARVKLRPPALLTCQLGLNVPRYPTLPNIMKAKKKELLVLPVADLLSEGAKAVTQKFYAPARKGGGLVLEGDTADLVDKTIAILKEKTGVLR
ncbi:MAG TPA: electron transfer flavoprotein subunit beta/FixA family protein [Rectinemataceae bacterium]|nr:electron transfer flavoprotein subunit beta/FixA family protein [Rectinemataceae bacterium]